MLDLIAAKVTDPRFLGMVLTGVATAATAFALLQPILEPDRLGKRMKLVGEEREDIRRRERERLAAKTSLRTAPKAYMKRIVERFSLDRWLGTETAKRQLVMAGYRSPGAETTFLFFASSRRSCSASWRSSTSSFCRCSTSPSRSGW